MNTTFSSTAPQMVSLRRKYAFLFSQAGCLFFHTKKTLFIFSFMNKRKVILFEFKKAFFLQT